MTHRLHLPVEHPALPGHFPDRPVIPAALLIEAMAAAVADDRGVVPRQVRQLRLLQPASPGQSLPITIDDRGGEEFLLTARDNAGAVVCKGIFGAAVPARPDWPPDRGPAAVHSTAGFYRQLPYGGAMRLIEQMEFWPEGGAGCDVDIQAGSPLATNGRLSGWTVIEYAAQLVACQGVSGGMCPGSGAFQPSVAGVRKLECHQQGIAVGDGPLSVRVRPLAQQPGAARFVFRVARMQDLLASGDFTVLYGESGIGR